ncbi:DUF1295 domain-containing protein [Aquimarina litoralis]|nr:DUF1295 domain-containing protein [Aquimarina litoralis]
MYVFIQFGLFIGYLWNPKFIAFKLPSIVIDLGLWLFIVGICTLLLALIQLRENLSPFPTPKKDAKLIKTGLYKFIRHPIYTGILLIAFGYAFYTHSIFKFFITIGLYILFYFKSKYEEKRLINFFSEYIDYQNTTGRFSPNFYKLFSKK